mmetsp:Transcript_21602/g.51265  ORF Transcript_21602/g.51265 Transcript_21602/m.51265 type:complete len:788 (+) Transcript_21602:524-2887(+)
MRRLGLHRQAGRGHAVAHIAAAVVGRIGVERFLPGGHAIRHAERVALARHRRQIADDDDHAARAVAAHPGVDRVFGIVGADPLETAGLAVQPVQCALLAVERVEVTHQALHAGMAVVLQQAPGERLGVVPFLTLGELLAHEQQLLARVAPHEPIVGAQIGELLPVVTGHLGEHAALAVHDLVMRDRQHEVLAERVDQAEGHLVVMPAAVDRVLGHVAQGVVHPAHIPFVVEAQTAGVGRCGNTGEAGAFLGHGDGTLDLADMLVHLAQQRDGLEVLAAAADVGNPLALGSGVVAVEHAGHRIHAQAVHAPALDPVERTADQELAHLGAAEVVDQRVPVAVEAFLRVGVLVEPRAVEFGQAMGVGREVRRYPVQQQAQPVVVHRLHEAGKALGRAEAGTGRAQPEGLVAPGAVERMLADRHQLDVREAEVGRVARKLLGQFVPGRELARHPAPPRRRMDLVDADWRLAPVGPLALARQLRRLGQGRDDAGRFGAQLRAPRIGVGLERQQRAAAVDDLELVQVALGRMRHEDFPDAGLVAQPHRMAPAIPVVEAADDADAPGIGRPGRKAHAAHLAMLDDMRPQTQPGPDVTPLGKGLQFVVTQLRVEGIGVGIDALPAAVPAHRQPVVEAVLAPRHLGLEEAAAALLERDDLLVAGSIQQRHLGRSRQQRPHPEPTVVVRVQTQPPEGIGMAASQQGVNVGVVQHQFSSAIWQTRPGPRTRRSCDRTRTGPCRRYCAAHARPRQCGRQTAHRPWPGWRRNRRNRPSAGRHRGAAGCRPERGSAPCRHC